MSSIPVFLMIRLLIGLTLSFLLVRKMRGFIRAMIVQCMPMKQRISPKSYTLQTRLTTLISIVLIALLSMLFNQFFLQLAQSTGIVEQTQIRSQEARTVTPLLRPIQEKPVSPEMAEPPILGATVEQALIKNEQVFKGQIQEQIQAGPIIIDQPIRLSEQYFVQVTALSSLQKAKNSYRKWRSKSQHSCWIAADEYSYKVLLGPFTSRKAANQYIRQRSLDAYPRKAQQLNFLQIED